MYSAENMGVEIPFFIYPVNRKILFSQLFPITYITQTVRLSERCTVISTICGRDSNAYRPTRLYNRVPLSERCTLIRTIFRRAEVFG
jgi:hypothetical protein